MVDVAEAMESVELTETAEAVKAAEAAGTAEGCRSVLRSSGWSSLLLLI